MSPVILRTATQFMLPLLVLFSVFLLFRGHDEPGGGFVGGLIAAAAVTLYAIAFDVSAARRLLRVEPQGLIASGLLVAAGSGAWALASGDPFLTSQWWTLALPLLGEWHVGTPVLFDVGVYLVVLGVTLLVLLTLMEDCPRPVGTETEEEERRR
jgi:multicomponent Na+:H+ antiporter subunit B